MNGNGNGQGLISKMFSWGLHPTYAGSDWVDWMAFAFVLILLGYLWSKTVRQTL